MPGQSALGRWRLWSMVVTVALTLAALFLVLRLGTPAYAQRPIITGWLAANAECKAGVPDDPKTLKACKNRDQIGARLKRRGCEYKEEGDWWKCPHH
jgi:hypothetical protein